MDFRRNDGTPSTSRRAADGHFLFYVHCPSVEEYIVAALATKPHR
jgi:hypothetical protein